MPVPPPPPLQCSSTTEANLGMKLEKKKGRKRKISPHTFWFSGAPFPSPQDSKTVFLPDFLVACALLQFLTWATHGWKLRDKRGETKGNLSCLPQRWSKISLTRRSHRLLQFHLKHPWATCTVWVTHHMFALSLGQSALNFPWWTIHFSMTQSSGVVAWVDTFLCSEVEQMIKAWLNQEWAETQSDSISVNPETHSGGIRAGALFPAWTQPESIRA